MTEARYRAQDIATTPAGWRVRSVQSGEHVIRVAFPEGPRRAGSGKVVQILHPKNNPACDCGSCLPNPAELVILGNPSRYEQLRAAREKSEHIRAAAALHRGNPTVPEQHQIKIAKQTLRMSDAMARVMGGMTKDEARAILRKHGITVKENPIQIQIRFDPAVKKYLASMYDPKFGNLYATGYTKKQAAGALRDEWRRARAAGTWRNPDGDDDAELDDAIDLFEEFHGREPEEILTEQRSIAMRHEYTAIGPLLGVAPHVEHLKIPAPEHWDDGGYPVLKFDGVMLAASAEGSQLYAIGGDQDLGDLLTEFPDVDTSKDLIDVCEIAYVVYEARKSLDGFELSQYQHEFDEPRPRLCFDRVKCEIFFVGGRYQVTAPGIEH